MKTNVRSPGSLWPPERDEAPEMAVARAISALVASQVAELERLRGSRPECPDRYYDRIELSDGSFIDDRDENWYPQMHDAAAMARRGAKREHRACLVWLSEVEAFAAPIGGPLAIAEAIHHINYMMDAGTASPFMHRIIGETPRIEVIRSHRWDPPVDAGASHLIWVRPGATKAEWMALWETVKPPRSNGRDRIMHRPHRAILLAMWVRSGLRPSAAARRWRARTGAVESATDEPWRAEVPRLERLAEREWREADRQKAALHAARGEVHEVGEDIDDRQAAREIRRVKEDLAWLEPRWGPVLGAPAPR